MLCSLHFFPHLFLETRYLIFLFLPSEKSFECVTKLIPVLFLFLFICSCTFELVYRSASLFALYLTLLFRVIFFSFTSAMSASYSAETSFHLSFGFACSLASTELLSPAALRKLLPPVFRGAIPPSAFPPITFLCHGLFQNRSCLLSTGQSFLMSDEHGDDWDTLCIVPELKGAAASGVTDRSSLLSFS